MTYHILFEFINIITALAATDASAYMGNTGIPKVRKRILSPNKENQTIVKDL